MSALAKTAGAVGCTLVALPLLAALIVAAFLGSLTPGGGSSSDTPSKHALADIPRYYLALYQRAAPECPGLSWTILAAIGKVETDHARHPTMVSSAGAVGPMQFLPTTFRAYAYPVPPGGKRPPTPWDPVDAVYAAARLLCSNGAKNGKNLKKAIWHYNHADWYVRKVLKQAAAYASASPAPSGAAAKAVAFARAQLGTPYVWGGDGPREGGFDCSGLTQAAYRSAGVSIPRVAQAQYDHGPHLRRGTPPAAGDLLFFGSSPRNITHVGIYAGQGRMIDAPRPGAHVRERTVDLSSRPDFRGATRPSAAQKKAGR
ncbi:bifunctional lytic transglycosylase/C40 family peptidase [Streptomyces sp. TRM66268-LWL]|uniref:Bifunctional lytic transglycosylase/C40 family peptidase n=1 Tax=Streptomyces polyasparticus TaxID=2767826 RepID=A0ABR7SXW3_9ACTN|nr:bifunctional lytic transglycosylase/C40 family peptidase [Streptomyces polyasparticus]MBC9719381.1 bifunctional lytic transglycosylase/C40 family peptidase [Streptomyces polyasparticus]